MLRLLPPSYQRLPHALYARSVIAPLSNIEQIACSVELASKLGLDDLDLARLGRLANGELALAEGAPVSQAYAGHSYGYFHPQLGDGRACLIGEVVDTDGEVWELHVKGSGPTPFARGLSGRLTLSAALVEFLVTEYLAAVGIPTTRTLAVYGASDQVFEIRGQTLCFERGALLVRAAPSHVRFGTFEMLYHTGQHELISALAEHVIERAGMQALLASKTRYADLLHWMTTRTAGLIAAWDALGFVHGMMNTDNLSVLGLTLDIGPCGFIDDCVGSYCPNAGDIYQRYRRERQAAVGLWNLECLAHALSPCVDLSTARDILSQYTVEYERARSHLLSHRLRVAGPDGPRNAAVVRALTLLEHADLDYTLFFSTLEQVGTSSLPRGTHAEAFLAHYERLRRDYPSGAAGPVNPRAIPRSCVLQDVTDAATRGDLGPFHALASFLRAPHYADAADAWAARPAPALRNLVRAHA